MRYNSVKKNLTKWKLTIYIFIVSLSLTGGAIDEKSSSPLPTSATSLKQPTSSSEPSSSSTTYSTNEEIYIDDEGVGSGHGGIHEDLEKHSDYSGSGFGPDDEDSIGNNNSRNNNKYHKPSETGGSYSSNNYNHGVGGVSLNNNGNEELPIISSTTTSSNRHKTQPSDTDLSFNVDQEDDRNDDEDYEGSGDSDDDDSDDDITDTDHEDVKPVNSDNNGNTKTTEKTVVANNNNNKDDGLDIYDEDNEDDEDSVVQNNTTDIQQANSTEISNTDIVNGNNEVIPGEEIGRTNTNQGGVVHDPKVIMNEERTSFFAQPGILAAVIGGAVVGLLCAILVVMFIVYRMRKKDEGSYALDEPKRSPAVNSYAKNGNNREFYA